MLPGHLAWLVPLVYQVLLAVLVYQGLLDLVAMTGQLVELEIKVIRDWQDPLVQLDRLGQQATLDLQD